MKLQQLFWGGFLLFAPFAANAYTNLTVNDPHQCCFNKSADIDAASLFIDAQKEFINYELEMTLSVGEYKAEEAVGHDTVEIVCNFDMPSGSFINGAQLLIDGEWVDAQLMSRKEAHAIYEGIVQRRRDPLIIYKNQGNNYQFKIFPLAVTESRTMKLRYAMPADVVGDNKAVVLPVDMLSASATPVDLKVLVKNSDEFQTPLFNDEKIVFGSSELEGYQEAVIPSEIIDENLQLTSSNEMSSPRFAAETDEEGETTYRFSFTPEDIFDFTESRNYLIMIDNDPEKRVDTAWYYYRDQVYYEGKQMFYDINALDNEVLLPQVKMMLSKLSDQDKFNIMVKNNGIYTYADDWVPATKEGIDAAIAAVASYDDEYTSDINGFLKAGMEWANQEATSAVLLSNSKEFIGQRAYDQNRAKAAEAVEDVLFEKPLAIFDITAIRNNDINTRYYYNRFLHNIARNLGSSCYNVYSLETLHSQFGYVLDSDRSQLVLFNVAASTDKGLLFDQVDNAGSILHPEDEFNQFGKITDAEIFSAVVSFKYNGERFQKRFDFEITDDNDEQIEKAWAVAIADKLNTQYTTDSKAEAEAISMENGVLTQNTSFLALEPGIEYTKCETCPDWGNWRPWGGLLMVDGPRLMTTDMALPEASTAIDVAGIEGVDVNTVYEDAYAKGAKEAEAEYNEAIKEIDSAYEKTLDAVEENCEISAKDAYKLGYKEGLANNTTAVAVVDTELKIYPNPFDTSFTVELEEGKAYSVRLLDEKGNVLIEKECTGTVTINQNGNELTGLVPGAYIVEVSDGTQVFKTVIVKK